MQPSVDLKSVAPTILNYLQLNPINVTFTDTKKKDEYGGSKVHARYMGKNGSITMRVQLPVMVCPFGLKQYKDTQSFSLSLSFGSEKEVSNYGDDGYFEQRQAFLKVCLALDECALKFLVANSARMFGETLDISVVRHKYKSLVDGLNNPDYPPKFHVSVPSNKGQFPPSMFFHQEENGDLTPIPATDLIKTETNKNIFACVCVVEFTGLYFKGGEVKWQTRLYQILTMDRKNSVMQRPNHCVIGSVDAPVIDNRHTESNDEIGGEEGIDFIIDNGKRVKVQ